MGFLKKALGKSVGGKLLGKAVKADPLGKKIMQKDPLMSKTIGKDLGVSGGKKTGGPSQKTTVGSALRARVQGGKTGPATPSQKASTLGNRMQKLGEFKGMGRKGRMIP